MSVGPWSIRLGIGETQIEVVAIGPAGGRLVFLRDDRSRDLLEGMTPAGAHALAGAIVQIADAVEGSADEDGS